MTEIFGVPVGNVALALGIVSLVIVGVLTVITLRTPILVQMAFRNVYRRPSRSALIVIGLMLATAIISSSFTTGDSMTFSIKQNTVNSLRFLDELIRVRLIPIVFRTGIHQKVGKRSGSPPAP